MTKEGSRHSPFRQEQSATPANILTSTKYLIRFHTAPNQTVKWWVDQSGNAPLLKFRAIRIDVFLHFNTINN